MISISILRDNGKVDAVERESSKIMEEFRTGSGLTGGYLPLDCERPVKSLPVLNSVLAA
jgi:hypothetical protein